MNLTHILKLAIMIALMGGGILMIYLSDTHTIADAEAILLITSALGLWITGLLPEYITTLLFFLCAMLFAIAPPEVIFFGFGSTALWLVLGGLILGIGITNTGLGKRIAETITPYLHGSYAKLIGGLVLINIFFSFVMPSSMGRIALLVPIAMAMATHFGFSTKSNGFTGIILATILGSFAPAFAILPANMPNMILAGMSESLYQYMPSYGAYLLLHFPIIGMLKAALIVGLIVYMYPDKPRVKDNHDMDPSGAMTRKEKILSVVLVSLVALWLTDGIHHISPAWIALAGAIVISLPHINIINKNDFDKKINYSSVFFIAGILGLGNLIQHSSIGDTLAKHLTTIMPLDVHTPFINYMTLSISAMLTSVVTTLPGTPAVLTPLASTLSQASGFSIPATVMTQIVGFSMILFPYQAPPILIGAHIADMPLRVILNICLILSMISIIFLVPLDYLWWQFLGWI